MTNRLTPETVANYAFAGGFRGNALVTAVAVAGAETGGTWDADAVSINSDQWHSRDRGLWQINDHWHPEVSDAEAFNPPTAAREAYRISNGGSNWKPWATFTSGAYRSYLDVARAAAQSAGLATSNSSGSSAGAQVKAFAPDNAAALNVKIGGLQASDALGYALVSGSVSLTTQEASQLTLGFQDPDYQLLERYQLVAGPAGTPVEALGVRWRMSALAVQPGAAGSQTMFTCQPSAVMRMRGEDTAPAAKNVSPTDYMAQLATGAGLQFRGQQSAKRGDIGPQKVTDQLTGQLREETAWEIGQRLATEEKFVAYESAGVYFFGSPQFLAQTAKMWQLSIRSQVAKPTSEYGDVIPVWGFPTIRATRIGNNDFPQRTLDCQVPREFAGKLRAGDGMNLAGIPVFPRLPALTVAARLEAMTITSIGWDLMDEVSPLRVQAADRSQVFSTPATAADAAATGLVISNEQGDLPAVIRTNTKSALDFVNFCLRQVGDKYVWGAGRDTGDPNPDAFDCSGLIFWAAAQCGVTVPETSQTQWSFCRDNGGSLSVDSAAYIRGALLFEAGSDGTPDSPGHVAVSLGDGTHTIEARGTAYGVNEQPFSNRNWSHAAKIPGMRYQ